MGTATMAFCINCGKAVGDADVFCGACGTQQPAAAARAGAATADPAGGLPATADPLSGLSPQMAAMLCYVPMLGWIMSIVVLAAERFRRDTATRFHAFQALYLFAAYLIVDWVLRPIFWGAGLGFNPAGLLKLALFGIFLYMMLMTHRGQTIRLPLVGELAEKSAAEQG